jgi:CheY-like chemotaxis protein
VEQQQGGKVIFDWKSAGLDCTLRIPFKDAFTKLRPRAKTTMNGNVQPAANSDLKQVMIVEDEMLVALDLQESVKALGYAVVGPFGRLAEAIEGAAAQPIDFAILDLNLNGEMTYDLAEQLEKRGIPIVFTTGYESDAIHSRLNNCRVLNKPVVKDALESVLREHFAPSLPPRKAAMR